MSEDENESHFFILSYRYYCFYSLDNRYIMSLQCTTKSLDILLAISTLERNYNQTET